MSIGDLAMAAAALDILREEQAENRRLNEALIDIRNRVLCPVGPAPTIDEIADIASSALAAGSRRAKTAKPLSDRFWSKVEKRDPNECWPWTGAKLNTGYGYLDTRRTEGRVRTAHRVSWELANGREPGADELVCHSCDNPICVNPAHLWLGTHTDNMRDAGNKGRFKDGRGQTHCIHGHPFDEANAYYYRGRRQCRACNAISVKAYKLRRTPHD